MPNKYNNAVPSDVELVDNGKPSKRPSPQISKEEADILQERIRQTVERVAQNLTRDIIDIARDLRTVRETNAWAYYTDTWTRYLEDYREFSRSYMFNLAKLGQAGDETLEKLLEMGLGATQLVEYARLAPSPDQIEPLVNRTWSDVKTLPVKEMAHLVRERALELQKPKAPPTGKPRGRKPKEWIERFKELLEQVPFDQRDDFSRAVRAVLKTIRE